MAVSCRVMMKKSRWRAKNLPAGRAGRSAISPIDFVQGDETVRMPQNLINGLNFSLIGFWG